MSKGQKTKSGKSQTRRLLDLCRDIRIKNEWENIGDKDWQRRSPNGKHMSMLELTLKLIIIYTGEGKFICRAQFIHKSIQSALQLYKIRRRQIKSFHKYKK